MQVPKTCDLPFVYAGIVESEGIEPTYRRFQRRALDHVGKLSIVHRGGFEPTNLSLIRQPLYQVELPVHFATTDYSNIKVTKALMNGISSHPRRHA